MKLLITSGPTRALLDAMRFIGNRSTGRFGTLLALEALRRGAKVTFVYGKGSAIPKPDCRLKLIEVETNAEVLDVLRRQLLGRSYDAVIHAMAVLDFQAARIMHGKTPTRKGPWTLVLKPAPKIISQIKGWAPKTILVGFKLEVGILQKELLRRARRLLRESHADFVLANQLTEGNDRSHIGILLDSTGAVVAEGTGKKKLAAIIIRELVSYVLEQKLPPHNNFKCA